MTRKQEHAASKLAIIMDAWDEAGYTLAQKQAMYKKARKRIAKAKKGRP